MWTAPSGNQYKLCLLDTNILSEISQNPSTTGRSYLSKFGPDQHVTCISVFSLFELNQKPKYLKSFVELFAAIPLVLLHPWRNVVEMEKSSQEVAPHKLFLISLQNDPVQPDYYLPRFVKRFFRDRSFKRLNSNWKAEEKEILESWRHNRSNFEVSADAPNKHDAPKYVSEAGIQTLIQTQREWVEHQLTNGHVPSLERFPTVMSMLYSQYFRIFDYKRQIQPQDVTDVRIMSAAPYMDVVITENFQANVFRQMKGLWPRIASLESYSLRDLRT